ncbi:adhesion G-protein coupled receptor G2-like isoform X5 [Gigantopelta aegis]|uniref:adhesion G-protein coupled receptor G2-like isoform X5 n=1 Tax=Gigantopelta aegis TaxID=1735272 RepID=UPI001B88A06F|nr:adhesion G-protein coupled receptor G2-like isoform X5 [Gigantopelta aegis]
MDVTLSAIRGTNQHGRDLNANRSIGLPHGTEKIVLSLIASLGTIACLAGLLFTVLTYTMFRNLRQEVPSKILLNLCVALFLTHFIFVVGVQEYIFKDDIACMIVGVLMHYFILSEMVWMAVDAMTMFFSIVVVYTTETRHLIFKGVCFGWGLPLMIVGLCVAYGLARGYGLPAKEIRTHVTLGKRSWDTARGSNRYTPMQAISSAEYLTTPALRGQRLFQRTAYNNAVVQKKQGLSNKTLCACVGFFSSICQQQMDGFIWKLQGPVSKMNELMFNDTPAQENTSAIGCQTMIRIP